MLLCGIIDELGKENGAANIAYFFCQESDARQNNAASVLYGLIYRLLKNSPGLTTRMREWSWVCEDGSMPSLPDVMLLV